MRLALILLFLPAVASAEAVSMADFSWLAGCWAFERDGKRYEETWFAPVADGAQGMARITQDGKIVNSEFIRLRNGPRGEVHYVATPSGQRETSFALIRLVGTRAEFENPAHDFPQRIVYTYAAPDRLDARIDGKANGEPLSIAYPYRRSACR